MNSAGLRWRLERVVPGEGCRVEAIRRQCAHDGLSQFRQGLLALVGEYASATPSLLGRSEEYHARLAAALAVTRPTFNEEMRAGHTNM